MKLSSDWTSPDVMGAQASPQDGPNRGGLLIGSGMPAANAVALSQFAKVIAPELDRFVIDRTNLSGRFDLRLRPVEFLLIDHTEKPGENQAGLATIKTPGATTPRQARME